MFSFSLQIAIFALTIPCVKSRVVVEPAPQDHITFAECALYVTQRYISTRTNNLFIMENCGSCNAVEERFHARLLDHYLRNFEARMSLQLNLGDEKDGHPSNYNLFIVNNQVAFNLDRLNFYISDDMHEPEFYFLILLTYTTRTVGELYYEMRKIFTKCVKFNIPNAVLMVRNLSGGVSFYTYNLFQRNCTRQISIIRCNHYHADILKNDKLFPLRLRNFHNCTLHVAARVLPPLLQVSGDINRTQLLRDMHSLTGLDGDLIKLLAKTMNFQMVIHFANDTSVIGRNRNLTDGLKMLQQHKVDIAIGGLSASGLRRHNLTASATYHHGSLVFILCSGLHFGPIKQLLIEFKTAVWLLIGFTIFVAFQIIRVIEYLETANIGVNLLGTNSTKARLNIISAMLGNPISNLPRTSVSRIVLLTWLSMTLVLRCAYQAKMFDALRLSIRLPIPRDLNDLLQQEYILLSRALYDFYPENRTFVLESFTSFEARFPVIEQFKAKFVATALLDNLANYNRLNYNTSNITYVREPIFDYQHVFYFQKHSVFKWTFDTKLKQLKSAGIIAHIARRHIKKEFLRINDGARFVPKISGRTLSGLYMIYGFAMGVALICFLLELVSKKPGCVYLRKYFEGTQRVDN